MQPPGLNLPWIDYGRDFGEFSTAPDGERVQGVHTEATAARVNQEFAKLAAAGVATIRWFVLCDGRSGIRFDPGTGFPAGVDDYCLADVRAALEIASRHGMQLVLSLLNYQFSLQQVRLPNGMVLFGHGGVLQSPVGRLELLENVITPVLQAIGNHPNVAAIEFMNEPELIITGQAPINFVHNSEVVGSSAVVAADLLELARLTGQQVHHETGKPYTVGSLSMRFMNQWIAALDARQGDFLQFHHYGTVAEAGRLRAPAGVPAVVGEFPISQVRSPVSHAEWLDAWHGGGWSACWGWRATADAGYDAANLLRIQSWTQYHRTELDLAQ